MGSVPNFDHDFLSSFNDNSLICLYYSTETPFNNAFPTAPRVTTSMILMYLHAVLGLFQIGRSMMEERSSPLKALGIAPPERKQCIQKSVFAPAARARFFRVCVIFTVVTGDLPPMRASPSALREMLGNKYPQDISRPMADTTETNCFTAVTGYVAKHS